MNSHDSCTEAAVNAVVTKQMLVNHLLAPGHPWPLPDVLPETWRAFADRGIWPARWVRIADADALPIVAAYRLHFTVAEASTQRVYVTADERYELFLNGERIGRGPEHGDPANWYFDGYDLPLEAGEHVLVALTWARGAALAGRNQLGLRHGFLLAAHDPAWQERLATGRGPWLGRRVDGLGFGKGVPEGVEGAWGSDEILTADEYPWGWEGGECDGWSAVLYDPGQSARSRDAARWVNNWEHRLRPGSLPPQISRSATGAHITAVDDGAWDTSVRTPFAAASTTPQAISTATALLSDTPWIIPPHCHRRILIDLETYRCGYVHLRWSGGARAVIVLALDEALHAPGVRTEKGNRSEVVGKVFSASGVRLHADGGAARRFSMLHWRAGRYALVAVETADDPLTLLGWTLEETGYPLEDAGSFSASDPLYAQLLPVAVRSLSACQHDTFMDCPFYEQLQWVGDMRPQVLATLCMSTDDRLVRRSLEYLADCRQGDAPVESVFPSPVHQVVPSYALWWVHMVGDYAWWRGDPEFVARLMPAVRATLEHLLRHKRTDGLVWTPPGWNYVDWPRSPGWRHGCPPGDEGGPHAVINLLLASSLLRMAHVEDWLGEPEYAARWRRHGNSVLAATERQFWVPEASCFADDLEHRHFSEHTQSAAVLVDALDENRRAGLLQALGSGMAGGQPLVRCSSFFEGALIEAYANLGMADHLLERYHLQSAWLEQGLTTTPEVPGETRSDCHAWSAHVRQHVITSILGIRPAEFGFTSVHIVPLLGNLNWAEGVLPHPAGPIRVRIDKRENGTRACIQLPEWLSGTCVLAGSAYHLIPGEQTIESSCRVDESPRSPDNQWR